MPQFGNRAWGTYAPVLPWQQIPTPPLPGASSLSRHSTLAHHSSSHAAPGNPACPLCRSQDLRAGKNCIKQILIDFMHFSIQKGTKDRTGKGTCSNQRCYCFPGFGQQGSAHTNTCMLPAWRGLSTPGLYLLTCRQNAFSMGSHQGADCEKK